jgi:hypothetical protein
MLTRAKLYRDTQRPQSAVGSIAGCTTRAGWLLACQAAEGERGIESIAKGAGRRGSSGRFGPPVARPGLFPSNPTGLDSLGKRVQHSVPVPSG